MRPIVLVGLMGAGKTTVGRLLAAEIGARFVDLDASIEARAGRSVADLFAARGEPGFRRLEAEATAALCGSPDGGDRRLVVAAGGGWMANEAARAALPDAVVVWLDVGPREAAERLRNQPGVRPLLEGRDPEAALRALLAERLPAYGQATYTVDTEGRTPGQVARRVAEAAGLVDAVNPEHHESR